MQETFSICIMGEDSPERKAELKKLAKEKDMSISKFLLFLVDEYKKRQERRKTNANRA